MAEQRSHTGRKAPKFPPFPSAAKWDEFVARLIALETEAHSLGLHATAQALNRAKNESGYERAQQVAKQIARDAHGSDDRVSEQQP